MPSLYSCFFLSPIYLFINESQKKSLQANMKAKQFRGPTQFKTAIVFLFL